MFTRTARGSTSHFSDLFRSLFPREGPPLPIPTILTTLLAFVTRSSSVRPSPATLQPSAKYAVHFEAGGTVPRQTSSSSPPVCLAFRESGRKTATASSLAAFVNPLPMRSRQHRNHLTEEDEPYTLSHAIATPFAR
ncbi:hypothetical protein L226DRAFT_255162 [Lentinus tigrinus ALCF2SS1-7]|uniref:uncharacterized protein n=1 Tax=Lentinus tigrinus ALCF2SS1-7 TaxID=1328758 RepID=UPI001165FCFA|nr:hypothetical protein L226DRAFT_255162 [Lentinus tigrinus ALCF2SS1-7]